MSGARNARFAAEGWGPEGRGLGGAERASTLLSDRLRSARDGPTRRQPAVTGAKPAQHRAVPGGDNAMLAATVALLVGRAAEIGVVGDIESVLAEPRRSDVVGVGSDREDAAAQDKQAHHHREPGRRG
jgi:hypothetical protein